MSMSVGGASVVVVEHKHGGMDCAAFRGKLEAVLQMINRGDLGGGIGYGCAEHKAALDKVEQQLAETRAHIAEMEAEDASGVDEEQCDGSRGALCSSQDPNNCNRQRDCPAFAHGVAPTDKGGA